MKKYGVPLLLVGLLFSISGRAQEKDTLLIHFDFNRSILRPDARSAIDSVLSTEGTARGSHAVLVKIELSGYCNSIGGNGTNDRLAWKRLVTTRDYLRSAGLSDTLFRNIKAYGKRSPLNDNADAIKRSLNRRVAIVFYTAADRPTGLPEVPDRQPVGPAPSPHPPGNPTVPALSPAPTLAEFFRDSARVGKTFVLRNLNFEAGRHVLMPYSDTALKELLRIMLAGPHLKIEIRGHVCCIMEQLDGLDFDTNTNDLSLRRARFVYDYLRERGVKTSRMSYHGFGASLKLYPEEDTEQEREENRRVEIKVIDRGR